MLISWIERKKEKRGSNIGHQLHSFILSPLCAKVLEQRLREGSRCETGFVHLLGLCHS